MAKFIEKTFRDLPHKLHLGGGKVKASDKQLKQYKEFFDIKPACKFGFPDGASAMAYDSQLKILAVGTKAGEVFVFGAPGVEFFASHGGGVEVKRLAFLPNEGRLVTLTSDNKLHKWELNGADTEQWHLDHVASLEAGPADEDGQRVTAVARLTADTIWVGYDGGKVRAVDVKAWKFTEVEISGETIANSLPEEAKAAVKAWGSVVAIEVAPAGADAAPAATADGEAAEDTQEKQPGEESKPESPLFVAIGFRFGTVAVVTPADGGAAVKHLLAAAAIPVSEASESATGLECLAWRLADSGCCTAATPRVLVTGYSDGAYAEWDISDEQPVLARQLGDRRTHYGPFPCESVSHVASAGALLAFSGGLAKNTHADRHAVTLLLEAGDKRQTCFELPAPAVGLALLPEMRCLLALCQTRLIAIDLDDADWKALRPPYLRCLAATESPVTVARVFGPLASLPEVLRAALDAAAAAADAGVFSERDWPLTGGQLVSGDESDDKYLLATGHIDGGVAFWQVDARHGIGRPLACLDTARLFQQDDGAAQNGGDDAAAAAFPSLKRVGTDFPNAKSTAKSVGLAVFGLDIVGEALLVSGAGGQVIVWSPTVDAAAVQLDIRTVRADLLAGSPAASYEWTGPAGLQVQSGSVEFGAPFRPSCVTLVEPPSPVTGVAYSQRWGILAVGTAHGLAIVNARDARLIEARTTLPAAPPAPAAAAVANGESDSAAAPEESGLTKSLRQSFRKLKKLRPGKKQQEYTVNAEKKTEEAPAEEKKDGGAETEKKADGNEAEKADVGADKKAEEEKEIKADEPAEKPEEAAAEKVEEAGVAVAGAVAPAPEKRKLSPLDPRPAGEISTVLLVETTLISASAHAPCLFAGDAAGRVLAFQLVKEKPQPKPEAEKKTDGDAAANAAETPATAETAEIVEGDWCAHLAKELHLRHGAPVAALYVLATRDHSTVTDGSVAADGSHELLVVSEEQVKLFALPSLKPRCKARLSGRLLSCGHAAFASATRPDAREVGLAAFLDDGSLLVLGLPSLRVHAWRANFRAAGSDGDTVFCCCRDRAIGSPVTVVLESYGASAAVITIHQLAGKVGAAFTRAAALRLPEGARKKDEPTTAAAATAAEVPAASATAAAPDAAAGDEAQPATEANGDDAVKATDERDGGADAAAAAGGAAPPTAGPVAADITMDDIKEYATGTLVMSETIPEDKRESTVSSTGGEAKEAPIPTAEVKVGDASPAPVSAEAPTVAVGADHCNSTSE